MKLSISMRRGFLLSLLAALLGVHGAAPLAADMSSSGDGALSADGAYVLDQRAGLA